MLYDSVVQASMKVWRALHGLGSYVSSLVGIPNSTPLATPEAITMSVGLENLMKLGRYDEALQEVERTIKRSPSLSAFATKALVELAAGRQFDAEHTLKQGQAFSERGRGTAGSDPRLELSQVQWLNGNVEGAVESLRARIHGMKNRSVRYADGAGGGTDGLILYYYGVRLKQTPIIDDAHQWLNQVKKKNRGGLKVWPGPLVRWYFGELDDSALLTEACGTSSMEGALTKATTDLLACRQLIDSFFHMAVRALGERKRSKSRQLFKTAASLSNPFVSTEWYLAQQEAHHLRR